jgi:hypothetical protein
MKKAILNIKVFALAALCAVSFYGCTISYTFSGASIPVGAKTFSVAYFPNNATMVAPSLSNAFTEALKDKFSRQTKLEQVTEGGDFALEGEITDYMSAPTAIGGDEYAAMNRLTVSVQVRFTNVIKPEASFNRAFKATADYNANLLLQDVEGTLIDEIVEILSDNIFNACASDWQ